MALIETSAQGYMHSSLHGESPNKANPDDADERDWSSCRKKKSRFHHFKADLSKAEAF